MKLFKKFLLAAGLVGLVGSLGFAKQVKAADDVVVTAGYDNSTGLVTWHWELKNEENVDSNMAYAERLKVTIGAESKEYELGEDYVPYDAEDKQSTEWSNVDIDAFVKEKGLSSSFSEKVMLTLYITDGTESASNEAAPKDAGTASYYSVSVSSADSKMGTASVKYNGSTGSKFLVRKLQPVTLLATEKSGYTFDSWTGTGVDQLDDASSDSADANVESEIKAVANFTQNGAPTPTPTPIITDQASLTYTIYDKKGGSVKAGTATIKSAPRSVTTVSGYYGEFEATNGSVVITKGVTTSDDGDRTATGTLSTGTYYIYAKGNSGYGDSATLTIVVEANTPKVTTSDFVEYITDGYTLEFKAKADNGSQDIKFAATSDFKDYVDSVEHSKNSDSDKTVTVKVKFKEKLDKGTNNKEIKLEATVDNRTAKIDSDTDTDTTKKVTIYSRPSASFSTSDRKLTYKTPTKVNTGTTDGKESDGDEKDNTLTKISEVKGVKLRVYNGDTSLGFTQTAKSSGTSATIDSSTMESLIINLSSKFSGDSATAKFRVYPNDSDGKYNKNVYADSSVSVYRAVITWTDEAGKTGSVNVYGFEGQTIDAATVEKVDQTLKGKNLRLTDDDGKTITSFKMGTSSSANDHKAVLGARESAADDSGLDRVPRTGQNNALVYVMVAIVACAVCGGLYVYNKKSKNL